MLEAGESAEVALAEGRHAWLQVVEGDVEVNGEKLASGDAAALSGEESVRVAAEGRAEVVLFDLA